MTATRDDLISAWRADMLAMPALTADDVLHARGKIDE